eukprot:TRINITY_DN69403_c0_g1_i1.p1 TRINITY_DN69403_c0_g1~~TRINITY_DN69403_c0_g1_i1.p1  ORF type:complete len:615 (-),score=115.47 TRINITY_DN69403_c0_g1_i1:23-1819(-)
MVASRQDGFDLEGEEELSVVGDEEDEKVEDDEYGQGAPKLPSGITKKVLRECPVEGWSAGRPKIGNRVFIHFVEKLQNGTQVDSSRDLGVPCEFTLGQTPRMVVLGLELAIQTMRRNEIATFEMAPKFAYDYMGSPSRVPPNATVIFEVELLGWELQEDLFGDGRAVKTTVCEGFGKYRPERGDEVAMELKCMDKHGNLLEEHKLMEHAVGDPVFGSLSRVVVQCLMHMVEGERASVALSSDCVLGERRYRDAKLEISLKNVFEAQDISPGLDKSLVKRVFVKGHGDEMPSLGSKVRLLVDAATDEGNSTIPGFIGPKTLEFTATQGEVCDALELAVLDMRASERAVLVCRTPVSQCCCEELGLVEIEVPVVRLTVELLGFSSSSTSVFDSLPLTERFSHAQMYKDAAGCLYSRQRYVLALDLYRRALDRASSKKDEQCRLEEVASVEKFRRVCELNRAACRLKIADFQGAREACNVVLREEPDNAKALYRRASAHFGLSDHGAAMQDLTVLLRRDANNAEARALRAQVKEAERKYSMEAKRTATLMIAGQNAPSAGAKVCAADASLGTTPERGRGREHPAAGGLLRLIACFAMPCGR